MGGGDASGAGAPGEEQGQEQKRAAAAAYDYEGDARWADYWSNVLVSPHLAAKPEVLGHFRRKFYQRYVDHDLVVQPMSSTGSTQPSRPDVTSSSPSASSESVRARNSGSTSRSAAPPPPPQTNRTANPLRFDARTILFSINAWVLVVAGLGMLPILPKHLADRACKLSMLGTVLSSGYSLYSTYGKPRELNMAAIQGWLQSVLGAKDFIHLMFSLLLVTSQLHLKSAEDDVPRACNSKLSPECVGENRTDRQPVHPPLCPVPRNTHASPRPNGGGSGSETDARTKSGFCRRCVRVAERQKNIRIY